MTTPSNPIDACYYRLAEDCLAEYGESTEDDVEALAAFIQAQVEGWLEVYETSLSGPFS